MPIYHLNIREQDALIADVEGQEFSSLNAAREDALQGAREILAERILAGDPLCRAVVEITDGTGNILDRVPFAKAVITRE